MKRFFDIIFSIAIVIIALPILLLVSFIIKCTSQGPIIFWTKRVGLLNKIFLMPKFRTMRLDTPQIASHLLENPKDYYVPFGNFLRKSSIDELPQVFSILIGDMSFVGPRPALFNQDELIALRTNKGIHLNIPGVTGLAQVKGRDNLSIHAKVKFDQEYSERRSLGFDLYIIWLTLLKVIKRDGISH